jgi:hypothetical protein
MRTSASCGLFSASLPAAFLKSGRIPAKSANNLNEKYSHNLLSSHYAVKPRNLLFIKRDGFGIDPPE